MKVLLIFGGKSSEYEVSCFSAASIIKNIKGHELIKLGITKEGKWIKTDADADDIASGKWLSHSSCVPVMLDINNSAIVAGNEKMTFDIVFPIIHGRNGEDGRIQGLLEMMNVKYVGSGLLSSAVCMDKAVTNVLLEVNGISHTPWISFNRYEYGRNRDEITRNVRKKLGYPAFVKPSNAGSSVGITKCRGEEELDKAIDNALKFDEKVIIEKSVVNPLEIEVSVMGNDVPVASVPGRIKAANEFYDYDAKYNNTASETIVPADINWSLAEKIKKIAAKAYKVCECRGFARVDFLVAQDGTIFINEINTIPGFTNISMFPKLFIASGIAYSDIIDRLIDYAVKDSKQ